MSATRQDNLTYIAINGTTYGLSREDYDSFAYLVPFFGDTLTAQLEAEARAKTISQLEPTDVDVKVIEVEDHPLPKILGPISETNFILPSVSDDESDENVIRIDITDDGLAADVTPLDENNKLKHFDYAGTRYTLSAIEHEEISKGAIDLDDSILIPILMEKTLLPPVPITQDNKKEKDGEIFAIYSGQVINLNSMKQDQSIRLMFSPRGKEDWRSIKNESTEEPTIAKPKM